MSFRNDVVGVNDQALFDGIAHTQAGMPHLLQYLWNKYAQYVQEQIQARNSPLSLQEGLQKAPATSFLKWASEFLQDNRVVENFFVDANHGLRLSNNDRMVVCPGISIQGTMQESGAVHVTEGKSQAGNDGVFNPNASLEI